MIMRYLVISALSLAVIVCFVSTALCGSPYSANGIGNVIPDDIGRSKSMGGVGIANDDGMNLLRDNPALLSAFDRFSFAFGALYGHTKTNIAGGENPTYGKIDPDVIKVILPIAKGVVLGWGLSPYSKTDTNILMPNIQNGVQINDTMFSFGGINVSSAGIAATYKEVIRVGFSLNYNFGMIQEEWKRTFPDNNELLTSKYFIKKKYKGYSNTLGILASIYKNTTLGIGYTTKSDMEMSTYVLSGYITNPEKLLITKTATLPSSWRIGIFSELRENLNAGMDIKFAQWEDAARQPKEKEMYNNTYRFGVGLRYIPSSRLNAKYYQTLPLSAGFRFGTLYYKSYPTINPVFEKAVTFGIEFPLKGEVGSIIISFEYGLRGDKNKNGWDENFMSAGVLLIGKIK